MLAIKFRACKVRGINEFLFTFPYKKLLTVLSSGQYESVAAQ